ncbi:MAG: transcriptional regulator [Betaproteobacteria bacterium]|nr:transcriptional regulator [Betaproteobacteria bacterium]
MPFLRVSLKCLIQKDFNPEPQTLGQHLRKRRQELGLTQAEVASKLGVSPFTVLNLENDRRKPTIAVVAALVHWLGYDPLPAPTTLRERMHAARRENGWTVREAAIRLGVDPATWGSWERSSRVPWKNYEDRLKAFLSVYQS